MAKAKKEKLTIEEKLQQALVKEQDRPYDVPGNWVWTRLGQISKIKGGKRLPQGHNLVEYETKYPYIRVTDFENESINMNNLKYLKENTFEIISNYTISSRDAYISIAGTIGKVGLIPFSLNGSNLTENAAKITDIVGTNNIYLMNLMRSNYMQLQISHSTLATTQPKLALFRISEFIIPLPPLPEQLRIVATIESLFGKLDRARELVQSALDTFGNRKAAILHKAFTGELTAKWREENGVGLDSCEDKRLKDVIQEKPRNGYSPSGVSYETNIKNLTLSATTSGIFKYNCYKYVDIEIAKESYLWLKNGDILIQRSNSIDYVGVCAIYDGADNEFIYPDLMMKIRANLEVIKTKFLFFSLSYDKSREYFRENATGTAGNMPKINQPTVMNLPIAIPSLIEQQEIVCILDDLFSKEQKAKELCNVIEKIDLMKKAILARAFRGELGTNDPNEESAMELLKTVFNEQS